MQAVQEEVLQSVGPRTPTEEVEDECTGPDEGAATDENEAEPVQRDTPDGTPPPSSPVHSPGATGDHTPFGSPEPAEPHSPPSEVEQQQDQETPGTPPPQRSPSPCPHTPPFTPPPMSPLSVSSEAGERGGASPPPPKRRRKSSRGRNRQQQQQDEFRLKVGT